MLLLHGPIKCWRLLWNDDGTVSVACCVRSSVGDMGTCWRRQRRANMMQFGEAAVPVSSSTGSTSVSVRNQQHVDLLGRGLELSLFRPKRNCVVLVSATSFAALAHRFMLQAPLEARRCERHNSNVPERNSQGQRHCAC